MVLESQQQRVSLGIVAARSFAECVERFERAFADGDRDLAVRLLERDLPLLAFGVAPERLVEMLTVLSEGSSASVPTLRTLRRLFAGGVADADFPALIREADDSGATLSGSGIPVGGLLRLFQATMTRRSGRVTDALAMMAEIQRGLSSSPGENGGSAAWQQLVSLQLGTTLMLAGDLQAALVQFDNVRLHASGAELFVFARDACAKAAVIETAYGSVERARALRDEAAAFPRSGSWVDEVHDAAIALVSTRTETRTGVGMLAAMSTVPVGGLDELFPFYVVSEQRAYAATTDLAGGAYRVAQLAQLADSVVEGDGFAGSALAIADGFNRILQGDLVGRTRVSVVPTPRSRRSRCWWRCATSRRAARVRRFSAPSCCASRRRGCACWRGGASR